MALINPTAKFMFVSRDFDEDLAEAVFVEAWKPNKILRLILVDTVKENIYIYNPFNKTMTSLNISSPINFFAYERRRLRNLHQYPLRVNIFPNFLYCKVTDNLTLALACAEVMNSIGQYLNATMVYIEPLSGRDFGAIGNGRLSGGLKEIEEQRVDISVTLRGIAFFYNATQLLMLNPVSDLKLCFVIPNEFYPPEIKIFPNEFFDRLTCLLLVISFMTIILLTYLLMYLNNSSSSSKIEMQLLFFIYFAIAVNSTVQNLPKSHIFRSIAATVFLVFIIINSSYQGLIITALNLGHGHNLKTMEELLTTNLTIFIPINTERLIHEFSFLPKDSVPRRVYDKAINSEIDSRPEAKRVAERRDAAVLIPHFYFKNYETNHLDPTTGKSYINLLQDCPYKYHISSTALRNSPYIEIFNDVLARLAEGGLFIHQFEVAKAELDLTYIRLAKKKMLKERKIRLISMEELWFLFFYYGMLLVVASLLLCVELIVKLRKRTKVTILKKNRCC